MRQGRRAGIVSQRSTGREWCVDEPREPGLPARAEAWRLLGEYTTKPGLLTHALAVEAAMRAYARRLGGDEEAWGLVGLLHDFDYERWPTPADHPFRGAEILARHGYPEWFRRAILSHASDSGVPRQTPLEHALFGCDELCGFLVACALVTPERALESVRVDSVRKKLRSKGFAASVSRDDIAAGAAELGLDLDEHIGFVLDALCAASGALGLPPRT
jgi:putative nucleotidyltransferase with HDIG domain